MKNVIISGAGQVGRFTAEVLQHKGHSITVIDQDIHALQSLDSVLEARLVQGSSCHSDVLEEAGIENCDALIAATNLDEINLLTGALGKKMGAEKSISRVHQRTFMDDRRLDHGLALGIDTLICPEELTSRAICSKLHDPGVAAVQRFAGDEIEMHQFIIKADTPAFHKPLSELDLPPGVRIIIVRRGDSCLVPDRETVLARDDVITVVVPTKFAKKLKSVFHAQRVEHQDIVIAGVSPVSDWILSQIDFKRFSVRLFEPNLQKAEEIASRYPDVTVLNADPVETHVFENEHLDEVFAFIAAAHNEEHNILGAIQARQRGVGCTFAIVENSVYLSSLEGIGIDYPFSPRIEGAKELLRLVDDSPIKVLSTLEDGGIQVFELKVEFGATGAGRSLKEINFPRATVVAAIQREKRVIAPSPGDIVEAGDVLVVIGPAKMESTLHKIFIRH